MAATNYNVQYDYSDMKALQNLLILFTSVSIVFVSNRYFVDIFPKVVLEFRCFLTIYFQIQI